MVDHIFWFYFLIYFFQLIQTSSRFNEWWLLADRQTLQVIGPCLGLVRDVQADEKEFFIITERSSSWRERFMLWLVCGIPIGEICMDVPAVFQYHLKAD